MRKAEKIYKEQIASQQLTNYLSTKKRTNHKTQSKKVECDKCGKKVHYGSLRRSGNRIHDELYCPSCFFN